LDFLHLVQIDDFVQDKLNLDLDQAIEIKLSEGPTTRLILLRALLYAHNRKPLLFILDVPDKSLS
jgi:hypothetical protein